MIISDRTEESTTCSCYNRCNCNKAYTYYIYIHYYIIAVLMMIAGSAKMSAQTGSGVKTSVNDTIPYGYFEDEREARDSTKFTRINKAQGKGDKSAMEYVMDKRYHNFGETWKKKWYSNLYLEAGGGFEQMVPPADNYSFNALTVGRMGVGWQYSRLSSVRLLATGGWGYQQNSNSIFYTVGARFDHLFNLSSYFYGYNPSRLLNVSTVAGAGWKYSTLGKSKKKGSAYDVHVGLQAKLYTGPHGYIAIEPYAGLGSDNTDLSEYRNWRKVDLTYGATLSYIYYFENNLTRESRRRLVKAADKKDALLNDSTLKSWAQPWFMEFSNGLNFTSTPQLGLTETMGMATTISVGKWLSPVVGIRLSGYLRHSTWLKDDLVPEDDLSPVRTVNQHAVYAGGRVEAMLNPLGFLKNFRWDSKAGLYIVGGGEMGWMQKNDTQRLSCQSESYTAGINLWGRLGQGLMAFVEPRYAYTEYKIPYSNKAASKVFSDDCLTVNIGLRIQNVGLKHSPATHDDNSTQQGRLSVGIGGGTNFKTTKKNFNSKTFLNYNGRVFADYMITRGIGVEAAFEFASMANSNLCHYWDCNLDYPNDNYLRTRKTGVMEFRHNYGFASVDALINLCRIMQGTGNRRPLFELQMLLGPSVSFGLSSSVTLDANERLQQNHVAVPVNELKNSTVFGFNGGLKLKCNVSRHISAFFAPTIYYMGQKEIAGFDYPKTKYLETMNIGVQYNL